MNVLAEGMKKLTDRFEAFMKTSSIGKSVVEDTTWTPPLWENEVCCMKGMKCWTGKFADKAAQEQYEKEIAKFEKELAKTMVEFNKLNLKKDRENAAKRALDLATARQALGQQSNKVRSYREELTALQEVLKNMD